MKASKSVLLLNVQEIKDSYIPVANWEAIKKKQTLYHEQLNERFRKMNEDKEIWEHELDNQIDSICERVMKQKFSSYDHVMKNFQGFFDVEELNSQFLQKADIEMINDLNISKIDKAEMSQYDGKIESLHERIKHISIIQAEILKSLIPHKNQKLQTKMDSEDYLKSINKFKNLGNQAEIVSKWINDHSLE